MKTRPLGHHKKPENPARSFLPDRVSVRAKRRRGLTAAFRFIPHAFALNCFPVCYDLYSPNWLSYIKVARARKITLPLPLPSALYVRLVPCTLGYNAKV